MEAWNPDLRSSNITSLTLFPYLSLVTVRINVTNAGPLNGFDLTINYNITAGPNVLQLMATGNELSGNLFDPNNPPPGCGIFVARADLDRPPGRIRFAAVTTGGCSVPGTGTLVTLTFVVTGIGATSIDFVQTNSFGKYISFLIGPSPNFPKLPFQTVNGYFRNKPGIPPVAIFSYTPLIPVQGDNLFFSAKKSFDPDNATLPGSGIRRYYWTFGDGGFPAAGAEVNHVFIFYFNVTLAGSFTVKLVLWDYEDLPSEKIVVVNVLGGYNKAQSENWSGYAVSALPGTVFNATGSWLVPAIQGPCPVSQDLHSSFWVGIDGWDSSTVEQTGTESACINGKPAYFAWYEFFPKRAVEIDKIAVNPGDVISAGVSYSPSTDKFTVTIADVTTSRSFTKSAKVDSALRDSAEWIAEAPSSSTGILPLAPFGTVYFGQESTGVGETCFATVGTQTGPIGSFGSTVSVITMAGANGVKAAPSALSGDKTSFSVTWRSAG